MKKILSLLSIISLSTIITTNIIACKKNNRNNETTVLQQPPENSNGKLINNPEIENLNNNKTYIGIAKNNDNTFYLVDGKKFNGKYYKYKSVYRGDGNSQPKDFKINNNTGEIIDGNEKIES